MADALDHLTRSDRALLRAMSAEAGTTPDAMFVQIVREYLGLVRSAPAALPESPLARAALRHSRAGRV